MYNVQANIFSEVQKDFFNVSLADPISPRVYVENGLLNILGAFWSPWL